MAWVLLLAPEVAHRWAVVGVVPNKVAVADHFVAFGGVPLCAVLDRPKTVTANVGQERPSRATAEVPELRRQQEW